MKTILSKKLTVYNENTGVYDTFDVLRGESAYEAAVRLGLFSGTEEEWLTQISNDRNEAQVKISEATEQVSAMSNEVLEAEQNVAEIGDRIIELATGAEECAQVCSDAAVVAVSESKAAAKYAALIASSTIKIDAEGNFIDVKDAMGAPPEKLLSNIEPYIRGSGDSSPDNVRNFIGYNGLTLIRPRGKNLLGGLAFAKTFQGSVPKATVNEDSCVLKFGVNDVVHLIAGHSKAAVSRFIPFHGKENTQYTVFLKAAEGITATHLNFKVLYSDRTIGDNLHMSTDETKVYVTRKNATVIGFVGSRGQGSIFVDCNMCGIMEGVLTVDDFEPFEGDVISVDMGGSVYGGTVDWINGAVAVPYAYQEFDERDILEYNVASTGMPYVRLTSLSTKHVIGGAHLCNRYPVKPGVAETQAALRIRDNGQVFLYDERFTDLDTATSLLSTEPLQLRYEIDPIVTTFDPPEFIMDKGSNTFWNATGATDVGYVADTKLYIDNKFAELQNAILAQGANI